MKTVHPQAEKHAMKPAMGCVMMAAGFVSVCPSFLTFYYEVYRRCLAAA
jgi:hypothetical protein